MTQRKLIVLTAQYWYDWAHKAVMPAEGSDPERPITEAERTLYMANALNHTENMLAFVLRDLFGMEDIVGIDMAKIKAAFEEVKKPPFLKLPQETQDQLIDWCAEGIRDAMNDTPEGFYAEVLCSYDQDMINEELEAMHEFRKESEETIVSEDEPPDIEPIEPEDQDQGDIEGAENEREQP